MNTCSETQQFPIPSKSRGTSKLNNTTINVSISFSLLLSFIGGMESNRICKGIKSSCWKKRKEEERREEGEEMGRSLIKQTKKKHEGQNSKISPSGPSPRLAGSTNQ